MPFLPVLDYFRTMFQIIYSLKNRGGILKSKFSLIAVTIIAI